MDKKVLDLLKERGISEQDYQDMLDNTGLDIEPVEEKPLEIEPIDPLINYAEPISLKQPSLQKDPAIPTPIPSIPENQEAFEVGTIKNYEEALKKAKEERAISRLAQSGNKLGSAIGGLISGQKAANVDDESYKAEQEEAFEPVKELQSKIQLQDTDPNSAKSKAYRDYLKKIGFPVSENASYATLKGLLPEASRHFDRQFEREFKQQENALRRAELGQRKEEVKSEKDNVEKDKFIERSSKNLANESKEFKKIETASRLAQNIDPKNAVGQITGLYTFISSLDPGSVVREGEISLATSAGGLSGKLEKVLSQLTSNPKLINEKTINDIKKEIARLSREHTKTYELTREKYFKQARSRGIPEDRFGEIDPYYEHLSKKDQKDPKIQDYAQKYNMSYEQAEALLRKRGYETK